MTLELVKQIDPIRQETWFIVKIDDEKQYFGSEADARRRYELLKTVSSKKEEIVLDSCEINVNLEENK